MQVLSQILELEQQISTEKLAEQLKTDIEFIKDALLTIEKNLFLQRENKGENPTFEFDTKQKKQLQKTSLEIASHALESSRDQRDLFLTSTFIGTKNEIELIHREIVKLYKQLGGFSSQGKKEELFQLNLQFFSLR